MHGPFQAEYYEAMQIELKTLAEIMKCWGLVPRTPNMKVIQSTWALKVKHYPDGTLKNSKQSFVLGATSNMKALIFLKHGPLLSNLPQYRS